MAVSETYVDPATGNDYKGASFTDGAFTHATLNLNKTNAFTANKANHWLYLDDNGSNGIVTGFYKIATWTDASNVILASDPSVSNADISDVKCTQADGTSGNPWHSVQGALDLITRNATDGNRINLKAGTADTLSATLSYTTYGTPTAVAQLIIQGYTTSAGDGGIGEIDGAATYSICTGWTYSNFRDLKLGNCGSADVLDFSNQNSVVNCEIHTSSGFGLDFGSNCMVLGCYLHTLTGTQVIDNGNGGRIFYSFFDVAPTTSVIDGATNSCIIGNIFDVSGADTSVKCIDVNGIAMTVVGNDFYCSNANTERAIHNQDHMTLILNNILEGWSGAGGDGIESDIGNGYVGANAVYNCANPYTLTAAKLNYAIAPNDTLAASAFTSASTNDFSINGTVTGVTEDAYPSSFRGL